MMTSQMNSNQELFLDILTKEEREALLTKKMEEIRKRNEALRKRHEEIEADRKGFDSAHKKVSSPQKEFKQFPEDVRKDHSAPADGRYKESSRPRQQKPVGRGKSPNKIHKDSQRAQDIRVVRSVSGDDTRNVCMLESQGEDNSRLKSTKSDPPRFQRSKENDERESFHRSPLKEGFQARQQNRNSAEFTDHIAYRGNQSGGSYEKLKQQHQDRPHSVHFDNRQNFRPAQNSSNNYHRQNSRENDTGRQTGFQSRQYHRKTSQEDYQRRQSWENEHDHRSPRSYDRRQNSRESDGEYHYIQKEKREGYDGSDFEPQAKRKHGGGRGRGFPRKENNPGYDFSKSQHLRNGNSQGYDFSKSPQGPPPDPAYNFLSDKSRDAISRDSRENENKDSGRRHPKNYGGEDFHNVKTKMKREKERQDRSRTGPPKSKMEMSINMTGKERRQYTEWKAEREKVDQARIDRQKSMSGEWRREWDVQKDPNEKDDISSPQRSEPGKRPAGRIGSGRFDRGEHEERSKGPGRPDRPQISKGQGQGVKGDRNDGQQRDSPHKFTNALRNEKPGSGKDSGSPRQPIGRGRGRGWGRGKPGGGNQEVGRVRTSSGDERKVDMKKDLLVIKLDNSPGKHDDSVEVEYSDGEVNGTSQQDGAPGTSPSKKSGIQTEELWWDEEGDEMGIALELEDVLEHKELFHDDGAQEFEYDEEGHLLVGGGQTSQADTDEWTDCTSEDVYSTDRSQTSVDADSALRVNVHLNPDAPEFTPSSPIMPLSPESNMSPPGREKVVNWKQGEGKKKTRSPKVSQNRKSAYVDNEDKAIREDRETTPKAENSEIHTTGEKMKNKDGGVKKINDKDSEVKTESVKSGSGDCKGSEVKTEPKKSGSTGKHEKSSEVKTEPLMSGSTENENACIGKNCDVAEATNIAPSDNDKILENLNSDSEGAKDTDNAQNSKIGSVQCTDQIATSEKGNMVRPSKDSTSDLLVEEGSNHDNPDSTKDEGNDPASDGSPGSDLLNTDTEPSKPQSDRSKDKELEVTKELGAESKDTDRKQPVQDTEGENKAPVDKEAS